MQHIFYLHSNITNIVAQSIIEKLQLNPQNCLIIFSPDRVSDFPKSFGSNIKRKTIPFFSVKNKENELIKKLRLFYFRLKRYFFYQNFKKKFTLYFPHYQLPGTSFLTSHPNCEGYYFIEEGLSSYNDKLYSKTDSKALFYITNNFLGSFSITPGSFQFLKPNYLLNLPVKKIESNLKDGEVIFVFDNLKMTYNLNPIDMVDVIYETFENFDGVIHLKFHPSQQQEERTIFLNELNAKRLNINILPDDEILEYAFLSKNIEVYSFVSSLLVYNRTLSKNRNQSISLINELMKRDSSVSDKLDIPTFLKVFNSNGVTIL